MLREKAKSEEDQNAKKNEGGGLADVDMNLEREIEAAQGLPT